MMATIESQLQLNDGMSSVLRKINSSLLLCLDSFEAMQNASDSAMNVKNIREAKSLLIESNEELRKITDGARQVNSCLEETTDRSDHLLGKIKKMVTAYLSVRSAVNFVKESVTSAFESQNINTQLAVSLKNTGLGMDAYHQIQDAAGQYGMYAQTAMVAAGAEFATYMSDANAIESMMGTLSNYATGMAVTEGLDLSTVDIADYATQLGKVLNGNFDGIAKKGFEVTDVQKEILQTGTDMEKAAVVADIINESWSGMYASMANTPEGQLLTLQNTINQMKEDMGTALLPVISKLVETVQANLPTIQQLIDSVGNAASAIIPILADIIGGAMSVAQFFIDNWSWIGPIILGIAAALTLYHGVMLAVNMVETIGSGIKAVSAAHTAMKAGADLAGAAAAKTATGAQVGLNTALLACPVIWILAAIVAIIAALYIVIGVINKVTGSTISATGVIMGVLATAGAFIWDLVLGCLELVLGVINCLVNPFIDIANFIGNVFTNPISSIIYLFQGMADTVLSILQKIASALDFVFGSSMADTVQGWRDGLKGKADEMVAEYAPNENYQNVMDNLDLSVDGLGLKRISYEDAWNTGYSLGESIANFGSASLFDATNSIEEMLAGNGGLSEIAGNTGNTAESLKETTEDLKYLRDIAEQEAINRFTTAEIKVDMTGMTNRIENETDLDGIISYLTEGVAEALATAGEGVY